MSTSLETGSDIHVVGRVRLFERSLTSDEFTALPPSETVKLELLEGYVTMAARPSVNHQHFLGKLFATLDDWVTRHNLGRMLIETLLELSSDNVVVPDLLFLSAEHFDQVAAKRVHAPVDLVVELLSPTDRRADRVTKLRKYAEAGIPWYWIVDLEARVVEEYALEGAGYGRPCTVAFHQPFEPRIFAGLLLNLAGFEWR